MKTLVIHSSILGQNSKSRQLIDELISSLASTDRDLTVTTRDLGADPVPYFDSALLGALFTPVDSRSDEQAQAIAQADALIEELMGAERVIFGVPIYNFGLPAQLKSYLDHVARAGVTFKYGADGVPVGLVPAREVFVVSARGGLAEGTPTDSVTPYLQTMLGFLGMNQVTFIAAEGQAMGADAAQAGMARARARIEAAVATLEAA